MSTAQHNIYPERPFKPFSLIFFIELWERFGWYGMQAILIYFMIKVVGLPDNIADHIFGAFTALAYAFLSVGGYIGDNILGSKRTTVVGAFVLAIGYIVLALNPQTYLFWGLGTILVPQKIMGLMMGIWFMVTAVAMLLGGYVAAFASIPKEITDPILTLPIYTNLFFKIGLATLILSVIMALAAPILKRYIVTNNPENNHYYNLKNKRKAICRSRIEVF